MKCRQSQWARPGCMAQKVDKWAFFKIETCTPPRICKLIRVICKLSFYIEKTHSRVQPTCTCTHSHLRDHVWERFVLKSCEYRSKFLNKLVVNKDKHLPAPRRNWETDPKLTEKDTTTSRSLLIINFRWPKRTANRAWPTGMERRQLGPKLREGGDEYPAEWHTFGVKRIFLTHFKPNSIVLLNPWCF